MISAIRSPNASLSVAQPRPPVTFAPRAADTIPPLNLRSSKEMSRELATKRLDLVRSKFEALKPLMLINPRAALKLAAEMARELKDIGKAFKDAGGKNVSDADMAMMRNSVSQANAADKAAAEANGTQVAADSWSKRLAAMENEMSADRGVFVLIRTFAEGLRDARDKIWGESLKSADPPSKEEWRAFDEELADLMDLMTPGGPSVSLIA